MTHYDNLGLDPTATDEAITGAYRSLANVLHPGEGGDAVTFSLLAESNRVLSDPRSRAAYDRTLQDSSAVEEPTSSIGQHRLHPTEPSLFDKVALRSYRKHGSQSYDAGKHLAGCLAARLGVLLMFLLLMTVIAVALVLA